MEKIYLITEITTDLDGYNTIYLNTKVFAKEQDARDYYSQMYKDNAVFADDIDEDADENMVIFYEEDSIPRLRKLYFEEKEIN